MTLHRNEVVRITDLATVSDVIEDLEFENCEIVGPAVLLPLDNVDIEHNGFDGALDAIVWPIGPDRKRIIGAVGLRNVAFRHCRFRRIGLAGNEEFILRFDVGSNAGDPRDAPPSPD